MGNAYSDNPHVVVTDNSAAWGNLAPGDTASCGVDYFTLEAVPEAQLGEQARLEIIVSGGCDFLDTFYITVQVGDSVFLPTGPDAYGYRGYDDGDESFGPCPQFQWVEIRGIGTQLILSDDETRVIDLPPEFGTLQHYSTTATQLSICGNGWVAPGASTSSAYWNGPLPSVDAPPSIIAVVWDDFYPPTGNGVWYYHDATSHRFVVEWDSVSYYANQSEFDKFQVFIYDQTVSTPTGDNLIVCQYLTANATTLATFGMQDASMTVGLLYGQDDEYPATSAPVAAGRAIAYTTLATGTAEPGGEARVRRVRVAPMPFRTSVQIEAGAGWQGQVSYRVCDRAGRLVRELESGSRAWDGRDQGGKSVRAGVYFLVATDGSATTRTKLVRVE